MYTVWDGIKNSSGKFNPATQILDKLQTGFEAGRPFNQIDSIFGEALTFLAQTVASALSQITKIGGLIVISLALIVTLITITIILTIRIIVLWILLILTPVAFLFSILPQTEKYWNQWVESLTKYAFTGPILIFFLWLAIKLSATVTNASKFSQIGTGIPSGDSNLKSFFFELLAKNMNLIMEMVTVVVTIWAGILIANQFGIKGAKSIDSLINSTMRLPGRLLGGFGYAMGVTGRINQWTMKWRQGARENKYQDLRKEKILAEKRGEVDVAKQKEEQMKALGNKMKSKDKWMVRMRKGFAMATPQTLKKEFAKVWNQSKDNYYEETEASLREFARDTVSLTSGRKRRDEKMAATNAEIDLDDANRQLKDLGIKYRAASDPKEKEDLKNQITNWAKGIATKASEDEAEQDENNPNSIVSDITARAMHGVGDYLVSQQGRSYLEDAKKLAPKKKREDWWDSIEVKEEKERRVKKADELIDKMKLTPEQMVAMLRRGDGDRAMQIALLRKIASQGKYFGDLMQKMIKSFNTDEMAQSLEGMTLNALKQAGNEEALKRFNQTIRKMAVDELKDRASEEEVFHGMRAAEVEGRKSHNLAQIGFVAFDQVTGKWRDASEDERISIMGKYVKDMRPIEFNQINTQTFDDPVAREALAKSGKWVGVANNERLVNDLKESISDNIFVKYGQEIHDKILDPANQTAFDRVRNFKQNPTGHPYKAP